MKLLRNMTATNLITYVDTTNGLDEVGALLIDDEWITYYKLWPGVFLWRLRAWWASLRGRDPAKHWPRINLEVRGFCNSVCAAHRRGVPVWKAKIGS